LYLQQPRFARLVRSPFRNGHSAPSHAT
jgi:hypothetical protein